MRVHTQQTGVHDGGGVFDSCASNNITSHKILNGPTSDEEDVEKISEDDPANEDILVVCI